MEDCCQVDYSLRYGEDSEEPYFTEGLLVPHRCLYSKTLSACPVSSSPNLEYPLGGIQSGESQTPILVLRIDRAPFVGAR